MNVAALRPYCRSVDVVVQSIARSALQVLSRGLSRTSLQVNFYRSPRLAAVIQRVVRTYDVDVVYVHLFRLAQHALNTIQYKILDLTDCISHELRLALPYRRGLMKLVYRLETPRVQRYESWIPAQFDECWVVSKRDQENVLELCPEANVVVVPNGVDTNHYRPLDGSARSPFDLAFVGHLGVFHNVDAVLYFYKCIFPRVRRDFPAARFLVIGQSPSRQVLDLRRDRSVVVTGFVEDLGKYLAEATVFVAPLRFAAGVQNKVLEAMAAELPVVASRLVNEGIGATNGRDIVIADGEGDFATAVSRLLQNPTARRQIGRAGRRFVQERFSWSVAVNRIAEIKPKRALKG